MTTTTALQLSTTSASEAVITTSKAKLLEAAGKLKITTQTELEHAADLLKQVSALGKKAEEERKKLVDPFNTGIKAINERFKTMIAPLTTAETSIKKAMLDYRQEEQRKAREAEEKARAEAEAKRKEEEERRRAEAEAAAKEVPQPTIDEAPPAILEPGEPYIPPHEVPLPPTMPVAAKPASMVRGFTGGGASFRKTWKVEVTDIAALAKACPEMVLPNMPELNKAVRDGIREIPGCRVFQEESIAVR